VVLATSYSLTGGVGILGSGKYSLEWQKTFQNLGSPSNFAKYYTSIGKYNRFGNAVATDSLRRGIKESLFLKSGNYNKGNLYINNKDREYSLFIDTGNFHVNYNSVFYSADDSRVNSETTGSCGKNNNSVIKNISSLYATLYNYSPNQHGDIDSVGWISTKWHTGFDENAKDIDNIFFGGNIYISPMSLKRKFPLFLSTAVGLAPLTKFEYSKYHNILKNRYYIDFGFSEKEKKIKSFIYPRLESDYNVSCKKTKGFYLDSDSHFYLYYYGNPIFYVESEINLHNRNVGKNLKDSFYPESGDYVNFTQEENVSIKEKNYYNYDNIYSINKNKYPYVTLPNNYNKRVWNRLYDKPNGVIYSQQDVSENDLYDPYTIFKPLDSKDFPSEYGKLIDINGIESNQILLRFEKESVLYNAIDNLADRLTSSTQNLGSGAIFNNTRPLEFSKTDMGDSGTQNSAFISNKYGHFWVDAKSGSVFMLKNGARGFINIAESNLNGSDSGMGSWFKRHLPFKSVKQIENLDIDNPLNGVGILLGWDNKKERLFLTKKDFIITDKNLNLCYCDGKYYKKQNAQSVINSEELSGAIFVEKRCCGLVFEKIVDGVKKEYVVYGEEIDIDPVKKDVSFTVAWSAKRGSWISYYDFIPDYYLSFREYFATGRNSDDDTFGIWGHLLTNRSYLVYYGNKYQWEIELSIKNEFRDRVLESVSYEMEARRYYNEYDYSNVVDKGMDELIIHNQSSNSGRLILINQKHNFSNYGKYPNTIDSVTQEIIQSQDDYETYNINYFFNRLKNSYSGVPVWINDENEIKKTLNPQAVSFYGKTLLERMYGNDFKLLFKSNETQHRLMLKWTLNLVDDKL
jgi:hypothetical protein